MEYDRRAERGEQLAGTGVVGERGFCRLLCAVRAS
jgi:hypothetical protein